MSCIPGVSWCFGQKGRNPLTQVLTIIQIRKDHCVLKKVTKKSPYLTSTWTREVGLVCVHVCRCPTILFSLKPGFTIPDFCLVTPKLCHKFGAGINPGSRLTIDSHGQLLASSPGPSPPQGEVWYTGGGLGMRLGQLHGSVTVEPLLSTSITKRNLQMYY